MQRDSIASRSVKSMYKRMQQEKMEKKEEKKIKVMKLGMRRKWGDNKRNEKGKCGDDEMR